MIRDNKAGFEFNKTFDSGLNNGNILGREEDFRNFIGDNVRSTTIKIFVVSVSFCTGS